MNANPKIKYFHYRTHSCVRIHNILNILPLSTAILFTMNMRPDLHRELAFCYRMAFRSEKANSN